MSHPFEHLPGPAQFGVGVFAATLLIAGGWLMAQPEGTLRRLGCSIVRFEVAGSAAKLGAILVRWGPQGKAAARKSLLIDSVLFIPGYVLLTSVIAAASAEVVGGQAGSGFLADVTRVAAYLAWAAGILDYLENASLAMVLKDDLGFGRVSQVAAIMKFAFICSALCWVVLIAAPLVVASRL